MSQEQDQVETVKPQKTRSGIALDRVFPSVPVVFLFVIAMLFFQVLMGWKIINLEREKQTLLDDRQRFQDHTENFPALQSQIKRMNIETQSLSIDISKKNRDLRQLQDDVEKQQGLMSERSINLQKMNVQLIEKQIVIDEAEKSLTDLMTRHQNIRIDIGNRKADISNLDAQKLGLMKSKAINEREVGNLKAEINRMEDRKGELLVHISKQEGIKKANLDSAEAVKQLERVVKDLETKTKPIGAIIQDIRESEKELSGQTNDLKIKLNTLEHKLNEMQGISSEYGSNEELFGREMVKLSEITTNISINEEELSEQVKRVGVLIGQKEVYEAKASELSDIANNISIEEKKLADEIANIRNLRVQFDQLYSEFSKLKILFIDKNDVSETTSQ